LPSDVPEHGRLAGLDGDAVEDHFAALISTSRIRSRSPTELPPEKTEHVLGQRRVDRGRQRLDRVLRGRQDHRRAAVRVDDRRRA
jgi:hypothetical protein